MMHTAELHKDLDNWTDFSFIKDKLYRLNTETNVCTWLDRSNGHHVCTHLKNQGISEIRLVLITGEYRYCAVWVKVNPLRVLKEGNFTDVFRAPDAELFFETLNSKLSDLFGKTLDFKTAVLHRVDVAINLKFDSQDIADHYLTLIQRGRIPDGFVRATVRDEKPGKKVFAQNVLYLASKTVRLNLYSKWKHAQMEAANGFVFKDMDQMKYMIRLEFQLFYPKIQKLFKQHNITDAQTFFASSDRLALQIAGYYLALMFGTGSFVPLATAKEMISEWSDVGAFKKNTAEMLIYFIEEVNRRRSINVALNNIQKKYGCSSEKARRLVKLLSEIGISPVTIPREWGILLLKNPFKMVYELIISGTEVVE